MVSINSRSAIQLREFPDETRGPHLPARQPDYKLLHDLQKAKRSLPEGARGAASSNAKDVVNGLMAALYDLYAAPLQVHLISRFGLRWQEAEDILQETMKSIYAKAESFQPDKNESTFVFAVGRNAAIDYLRKKKRRAETLSLNEAVSDYGSADSPNGHMVRTSRELRPEEKLSIEESLHLVSQMKSEIESHVFRMTGRRSYILMFASGLRYREIAERENIPLGTMKSRIAQEAKMLKKHFAQRREVISFIRNDLSKLTMGSLC